MQKKERNNHRKQARKKEKTGNAKPHVLDPSRIGDIHVAIWYTNMFAAVMQRSDIYTHIYTGRHKTAFMTEQT